jgi:hypothetical protein
MKTLHSIVEISSRFKRSVNIGSDLQDSNLSHRDYKLQNSGVSVLSTIASHVKDTNQRAFTVTGSYGSGKSSLGLFLCDLCGSDQKLKDIALSKLAQFTDVRVIYEVFNKEPKKICVISGTSGLIEEDVSGALFGIRSQGVLERLRTDASVLSHPTLLIIDEMGRYLSGNGQENCIFLQEFAEYLNSGKSDILLVGILHQNFASYASANSALDREEWMKVQGRFVDVPLLSYPEETLQMLASALTCSEPDQGNRTLSEKAVNLTLNYLSEKRHINRQSYEKSLLESWPLNPVVSLILGPLSRRGFWQNNRSIFNFLTSPEPFGFSDFLQTTSADSPALYGLDNLWDYLQNNYSQVISVDASDGHRWNLACDCVERAKEKGTENHVRLAKIISLIALFKSGSNLESDERVLQASMPELTPEKLRALLKDLVSWKIIIERRHLGSFALFEGSDFDFEKNLVKLSEEDIDPRLINSIAKFPSLVARRHYAETGYLRWFGLEVVNSESLMDSIIKPLEGASGRFLLWLSTEEFAAPEDFKWPENIFVGVPKNRRTILSLAIELQQLHALLDMPELEGDRTARKEVEIRTEIALSRLKGEVDASFAEVKWIQPRRWRNTTRGFKDLNGFASEICDAFYPKTIVFHNELINRQNLSTNIRTAQKKLIFAMLNSSGEPRLGIVGFPPEAMIYLSFFEKNRLHGRTADGQFAFKPLDERSPVGRLWIDTEQFLKTNSDTNLQDLYKFWEEPPFGLKRGMVPILFFYFLITHPDVLSFYYKDVYQPTVSEELVELAVASPKDFKVRYQAVDPQKSELPQCLCAVLGKFDPTIRGEDALSVARSLVQVVLSLPKWALSTNRAGQKAKEFREAVLKAWDPLDLIYTELPRVFGNAGAKETAEMVGEAVKELRSLTPQLLAEIHEHFMKSIDAGDNYAFLNQRAKAIKGMSGQLQQEAFIGRVESYAGKESDIEGLLGLAASKMRGQWSDIDVVKAKAKISEWSFAFRHLEGMASLQHKTANRRLFGLVMAGNAGRKDLVLDVPMELPSEAKDALSRVSDVLGALPRDVALSVLIESSLGILDKTETKNE